MDDTNINNLFAFSSFDVKEVGADYGPIYGMAVAGYVLKVYQSRKANSVYIGRTTASNSDGSENEFQLISGVIGTIKASNENYGCQNPESIVKRGRHIYFFDMVNGLWIRDAANGLFPISSYKYSRYWLDKTRQMKQNGIDNFLVLGAFDQENDSLITSVVTESSSLKGMEDTVLFHEASNRWVLHLDISPKYYGFIGDSLFAFEGNSLSRFNWDSANPNQFFGSFLIPKITYVARTEGLIEKIFNYMAVYANVAMSADSIEIPSEYSASKRDMVSRIKVENFRRSESAFYAEIRKDMNTPGYNSQVAALNRGDSMRGRACIITLLYNPKEPGYFEFFAALAEESISMKSP